MINCMRKIIVRALLGALNSRFLNSSPCRYGFIGNVDAFSYENLASEDNQRPGITVRTILDDADRFRACPMRKDGGLTVMEADGTSREPTESDMRDLRNAFASREYNSPGDRQRFGE